MDQRRVVSRLGRLNEQNALYYWASPQRPLSGSSK
jgi:hypothetical protein